MILFLLCILSQLIQPNFSLDFEAQKESLCQIQDTVITFDTIEFFGNTKTQDSYLLTILGLNPNQFYSRTEVDEKVNFLNSINGIYDTRYQVVTKQNSRFLQVFVNEQKTLLPIFNFGLQPTNKWFQIGLVDLNLSGKGNELLIYYQNNQSRHSGEIFYKKNRIYNSKLSLGVSLLRWESIEPVNFEGAGRFDYDFTINQLGSEIGYQNGNGFSGIFGISFFQENYYSILQSDVPGPLDLSLNKFLTKWRVGYNSLQYDGIYRKNYDLRFDYQNVYTLEYNQLFHIMTINYVHYFRLAQKRELAYRINCGTSTNNDSPFAPFVIDSYKNVRGVGDRIDRGTAVSTFNIEFRQELFKYNHIILQGILFSDASLLRLPGEEFAMATLENYLSTGIGVRIHYTKIFNAILRIDYAIEYNQNRDQLIIGIGQYF